MSLNPSYNEKSEFVNEVLPMGTYPVRLIEITVRSGEFGESWMWKFETTKTVRTDGKSFYLFKFTNTCYGNDRSRLTKMLDGIYGQRFTVEEFDGYDVQQLEGHEFLALVNPITKGGSQMNDVLGISAVDLNTIPWPPNYVPSKPQAPALPLHDARTPAVKAATVDDSAPEPLTEKQRAALAKRLKLTDEEAAAMDAFGNLPGEDGFDPFAGDN